MTYAARTKVSPDKSETEIRQMVMKRGAVDYGVRFSEASAVIAFVLNGRQIRFHVPLPKRPHPGPFKSNKAEATYDQARREKWRALVLAIKSKLVIVDTGITTFEQEFLAHIVDPESNQTVWERLKPQIASSYSGTPRPLLLDSSTEKEKSEK